MTSGSLQSNSVPSSILPAIVSLICIPQTQKFNRKLLFLHVYLFRQKPKSKLSFSPNANVLAKNCMLCLKVKFNIFMASYQIAFKNEN